MQRRDFLKTNLGILLGSTLGTGVAAASAQKLLESDGAAKCGKGFERAEILSAVAALNPDSLPGLYSFSVGCIQPHRHVVFLPAEVLAEGFQISSITTKAEIRPQGYPSNLDVKHAGIGKMERKNADPVLVVATSPAFNATWKDFNNHWNATGLVVAPDHHHPVMFRQSDLLSIQQAVNRGPSNIQVFAQQYKLQARLGLSGQIEMGHLFNSWFTIDQLEANFPSRSY